MPKKVRIAILGIGGVGGYFGGLLAEHYSQSETYEIIFIARGETLKQIVMDGLKITKIDYQKTIYPGLVSDDPEKIGELDYLIIATKSYDLLTSLIAYKRCLKSSTIIIPLLNGVEAKTVIAQEFPDLEVWEACVYIVARIISPAVIAITGTNQLFYFGSKMADQSKLKEFENFLLSSSINAALSDNIEQIIWEKFIFISSIASLTCYLDKSIGNILSTAEYKQSLIKLLNEIIKLASVKNIKLSDMFLDKVLEKMTKLPPETTSSMHYDFIHGKKTEYQTLTEFVVNESIRYNIECNEYSKILAYFKNEH